MFDLLIKGGRIISGSGDPWYYGDIGIRGEKIAAIGKFEEKDACRILDISSKVVCPGFIDIHTHSDVMLLANPRHEPKIMQGITTEVIGLDGLSYAPLSSNNLKLMRLYLAALNGAPNIDWDWSTVTEFLDRFDRKVAINVVYLIPHSCPRLEVIGFTNSRANREELLAMQNIVGQSMKEGAAGISFGLDYYPGRYANTDELIELCKTIAEHNGVSVWHMRVKDLGLMEGIKEVLKVAGESNVKVHFSHFAANGPQNKGKSHEMLAMVDEGRAKGIDITFDSYPYVSSSTSLIIFFPGWAHDGGPNALLARLADHQTKKKICEELEVAKPDWERIFLAVAESEKNSNYVGRSFKEGAEMAGKNPAEFLCDLAYEEKLNAGHISFTGNEEDIKRIMQHPCHTLCSDGILVGGKPNPRGWGAFPRSLGHYCRQLGVMSIEQTVRRMTSAPAQCLGLNDRGLIKEGLAADLVVFDSDTVIDTATFEEPRNYPTGIDYVIVNGAVAIEKNKHTGVLNGKALKK